MPTNPLKKKYTNIRNRYALGTDPHQCRDTMPILLFRLTIEKLTDKKIGT